MLKKLAFRLSLSSALRELGINEIVLNSPLSTEVVDQARKTGLTPKEVAIGIYAATAGRMNAMDKLAAQDVVRDWRLQPEVRELHYQTAMRGELFSLRVS
ncbi:hypothetical protein [Hydrogenophaga sp. 2FB]|uniref:hypothetical protein n=1 Tax=Hydrogenophaga sp. 2FB TaxID=2502187 RepID=UPI0010F62FF4|nr:hypothetical protein [Hydrogenophaga sp. 2FB]